MGLNDNCGTRGHEAKIVFNGIIINIYFKGKILENLFLN